MVGKSIALKRKKILYKIKILDLTCIDITISEYYIFWILIFRHINKW